MGSARPMTPEEILDFTTPEQIQRFSDQLRPMGQEAKAYVYIIRCGDFAKIGLTSGRSGGRRAAAMRLAALAVCNPYDMAVEAVWEADRAAEKALHLRFAHLLHRGEWFRWEEELRVYAAEAAHG
jgi:hypothetical protein